MTTNHREDGEFGEGATTMTVAQFEAGRAKADIVLMLHRRDGDGLAEAIDRLLNIRVAAAIEALTDRIEDASGIRP